VARHRCGAKITLSQLFISHLQQSEESAREPQINLFSACVGLISISRNTQLTARLGRFILLSGTTG